ncbi:MULTISPECIES: hypothetical protein [Methylomonas]|uniref:Uncharacterized protein n=3 Tax=Methylomonas TaxID=416 RepID=A0A126T165_9GAMM|nr:MULTISPECIES: hypothetical protein [Methylomonas]AMK75823.1 hypothetical protein JT25_004865 [Methylomonas denitrificans]OAH98578.1 hypothetical protein A1342_07480 [Methylomonas methanica]TCV80180.1 hypothetical protein EDE11_11855 [Methylomonas methanica]
MNQPIDELQQTPPRRMKHRLLGYSNTALLLAACNLVIWIFLLFPIYAATDGVSNSDGLRFLITAFILMDLVGLGLASVAMFKSKLRKTMASYGFVLNIAMIGLNLSVFPF